MDTDPAFSKEGLPTGAEVPINLNDDLAPKGGEDPQNPNMPEESPYSRAARLQRESQDYIGGDMYGGLQSVLIPVEQVSLFSSFNIMVAVILVLVLILIYYVMQLQKKQSCRTTKRRSQVQSEDDPLQLSIVQDNSLQGFEVNKSLTDYMSYGNVPVHSSNSAVLAVGTYDGQTYIPNSSKNKLLRDALLTKEMGPRSQTDVQGMVEYEHARKMG